MADVKSETEPILEVTVECSNGHATTYSPTITELKAMAADLDVQKDPDGNIITVTGNVKGLTCPVCAVTTSFGAAIHVPSWTVVIYDVDTSLPVGWEVLE